MIGGYSLKGGREKNYIYILSRHKIQRSFLKDNKAGGVGRMTFSCFLFVSYGERELEHKQVLLRMIITAHFLKITMPT